MIKRYRIVLSAPLLLIAACSDETAPDDSPASAAEGEATGTVLGGTISDDMLPLEQLGSQSPSAKDDPEGARSSGDNAGDGSPASSSSSAPASSSAEDSPSEDTGDSASDPAQGATPASEPVPNPAPSAAPPAPAGPSDAPSVAPPLDDGI